MQRLVLAPSRACALLGGILLVIIVVLTVGEVFSRRLLGSSLGAVDEISGYLFAAGLTLSMAYAFQQRAHIRIDILYARMSPAMRAAADLVALAVLTVFSGFLAVRGWSVFATSLAQGSRSNSTLGMPLVIPQGVWLAGLALFFAVLAFYCLGAMRTLLAGRLDWIVKHLSPPDTDELVDMELEAMAARNRSDPR